MEKEGEGFTKEGEGEREMMEGQGEGIAREGERNMEREGKKGHHEVGEA